MQYPHCTKKAKSYFIIMLCQSFPPAGSKDPLIMILGSMPGPVSLANQQYYAHPQNSFWKIMGDLFGAHRELEYERRLDILAERRITLWEALESCIRPGSSDSNINEEVPNDFNNFFERHPNVKHLFFDGGMAFRTFKRLVQPSLIRNDIPITFLPSTSPRNARMTYDEKLKAWKIIKQVLETGRFAVSKDFLAPAG